MTLPEYDDVSELAAFVRDSLSVGGDTAERIARELDAEANHELGDPGELWQSIKDGRGIIADVGVDILSGVDVPAVDSTMLAMKSKTGAVWGGQRDVLLSKDDTDQRISYAAAMIPREADKEGETVSTPTVEKAAHDYLKGLQDTEGTGVDTDHNLIDDKGHVVESWVLKEDREFDLPEAGTKTHKAGDWIVGIEWKQEAWSRVKSGDIEGISIYGTAEQIPVERARKDAIQKPTEFTEDIPDDISTMSGCINWAESETDVDEPAAFCQANNLGRSAKNLDDPEFAEGDAVQWSSNDEPVHGRVAGIHEQFNPAEGVTITGDEGEAVYSIYEWDDSLESPVFRDSPSNPNVAKPQSSLSESQLDMPPASEDNFEVEQSVGKEFVVPFASETVVHVVYESRTAAEKASEAMGLNGEVHSHEMDGMDVFMPGADHESFVEAYMEMAESEEDSVAMQEDAYKAAYPDHYERAGSTTDQWGNTVPLFAPGRAAKRLRKRQND